MASSKESSSSFQLSHDSLRSHVYLSNQDLNPMFEGQGKYFSHNNRARLVEDIWANMIDVYGSFTENGLRVLTGSIQERTQAGGDWHTITGKEALVGKKGLAPTIGSIALSAGWDMN